MKIILISGAQGSGKTTLAKALFQRLDLLCIHKFAEPVYKMHDAVWREMREVLGQDRSLVDGELLQYLGTEFGRKRFGEDVWVRALAGRLIMDSSKVCVVDDLRFRSEAEHLERYLPTYAEIFRIRLEADEGIRRLRATKWRSDVTHVSETDLDTYDRWDLVIDTNSMCASEYVMDILKVCGI